MPPKPILLALWSAFLLYFLVSRARALGNQRTTHGKKREEGAYISYVVMNNSTQAGGIGVEILINVARANLHTGVTDTVLPMYLHAK